MTPEEIQTRKETLEKFMRAVYRRDTDRIGFAPWLLFDHIDVGQHDLPPIDLFERKAPGSFELLKAGAEPYSILALNSFPEIWIHEKDIRTLRVHVEAVFVRGSSLLQELSHDERARLVRATAIQVVDDLFDAPTPENIARGTKVVGSMVYTLMKDPKAYFLLNRLSAHDPYTLQHSVGTAVNSIILARRMGMTTEEQLNEAGIAGLLHDLGKVKVKKEIINKTGPLDEFEWEEMRQHSLEGYEIVKNDPNVPELAKLAILEHHEDKNGTGYPHGKKTSELHLLSRIVCISDIFNALTTNRTYSQALPVFDALHLMRTQLHHKIDEDVFRELVILFSN